MKLTTGRFDLTLETGGDSVFTYRSGSTEGGLVAVASPRFEIEGREIVATVREWKSAGAARELGGSREHVFEGSLNHDDALTLELAVRVHDATPVLRFAFRLRDRGRRVLTKSQGHDALSYFGISLASYREVREVRLSEWNDLTHCYQPAEYGVDEAAFAAGCTLMGPIITAEGDRESLLVAYEHGSQVPDAFVEFALGSNRLLECRAVKGNYFAGQTADRFSTIWFQLACAPGDTDDLSRAYRAFVLHHFAERPSSRRPFVYYNTWNLQERSKYIDRKETSDPLRTELVLAEIERAHRMGVDVFVIDAGWQSQPGDWEIDGGKFPGGLSSIRAALDERGMRLGLWFNPNEAAVSSRIYQEHTDCAMTWSEHKPDPAATHRRMCMPSRFGEAMVERLIALAKETGATYFKWDGVHQYGCDDPTHGHGTRDNGNEERADSYAFQLALSMVRAAERLCAACPEAIVDFDVTEAQRSFGLAFLSVGKYFLLNNGPYYENFDAPLPENKNWNLFFQPGPARGWLCRAGLAFDRWIPSVLFLTHFFPDDADTNGWTIPFWTVSGRRPASGEDQQMMSLASLVLGPGGVWGDLARVSAQGQARFGSILELYKRVAEDITEASLVQTGARGSSPEIYEKVSAATGRGVVAFFANQRGSFVYLTHSSVAKSHWSSRGLEIDAGPEGRVLMTAHFDGPGAKLVFFGTEPESIDLALA
jgi:alpha-galactosidase